MDEQRQVLTADALCIADKEKMLLKGGVTTVTQQMLEVRVSKCTGQSCKSEEEIEEFLEVHSLILLNQYRIIEIENEEEPVKPTYLVAFGENIKYKDETKILSQSLEQNNFGRKDKWYNFFETAVEIDYLTPSNAREEYVASYRQF